MACGLPLIMTKSGVIDLNIEKEGFGIYVDPEDAAGWERTCNWMLSHAGHARAMGECAKQLAESWYNTRRLGEQLAFVLLELVNTQQMDL
jgi:glycosyltransferase involved in cell wall biosynthesis